MVGFRIMLVVAIPAMYFLCISVAGLFNGGEIGKVESRTGSLDFIRESKMPLSPWLIKYGN